MAETAEHLSSSSGPAEERLRGSKSNELSTPTPRTPHLPPCGCALKNPCVSRAAAEAETDRVQELRCIFVNVPVVVAVGDM